ncbi:hypothetical protein GGF46_004424 [Coemansia sp. RSA 552]|nr:hypothetical protein GGF46_004424 [Coemansia sp. RSA 552]
MVSVVPAQPGLAARKALYELDPLTYEATRLTADAGWHAADDAALLSILVLGASATPPPGTERKLVWVWAQLTPPGTRTAGALQGLVLSTPPPAGRARGSTAQLLPAPADDPSSDVARRLSARFRRPIYLSLSNVGPARADPAGTTPSTPDELAALERCLVAELRTALSA